MRSMARRPSRTALKIARFTVLIDADPRLHVVLPADRGSTTQAVLEGSGALPSWQVSMMRRPAVRRFARGAERVTGRGQLLWFGLRKRWIADRVGDAIGAGARQLLVVGSGFDTLAAQAAAGAPDVLAVETDAAATAGAKRTGLAAAGLRAPNLEVLDDPLGDRALADLLAATGWDRQAPSVVVAEGLLMYLTPADLDRLFRDLAACVGPGSTLLCSSVFARADGSPRVAAGRLDRPIRAVLRLAGERMYLGLDPEAVPAFLAARGATVRSQPTIDDLRAAYLAPNGLADEHVMPYEHLIEADLG
jgi:methyltransferase (TIGR00027 family)